jgi:2,4-dienoyl-CoA reductase-like NADH-dependent reductase (Old Yellow Enzyme family)
MRQHYSGAIAVNSDYDGPSAHARLGEGIVDAISFGRPYISNPDLVERIRRGAALKPGDADTFYSGGASGYVDYPTLDEEREAA